MHDVTVAEGRRGCNAPFSLTSSISLMDVAAFSTLKHKSKQPITYVDVYVYMLATFIQSTSSSYILTTFWFQNVQLRCL
jgi:hypothetical protein